MIHEYTFVVLWATVSRLQPCVPKVFEGIYSSYWNTGKPTTIIRRVHGSVLGGQGLAEAETKVEGVERQIQNGQRR